MTVAGTLSFLFADLRDYTAFVETHGDAAAAALIADYRRLVRAEVARTGGGEIKTEGDSFYVVFPSARQALQAGLGILRKAERRSRERPDRPFRIGVGIHAGEPVPHEGQYVGSAVNIAARLAQQAGPGELLVSDLVRGLLRTSGAPPMRQREGIVLKGIKEPLLVYEVKVEAHDRKPAGLPAGGGPRGLPAQMSTFVGRARDLTELARLLENHRLVTVIGMGGVGKTRVVLEAARRVNNGAGTHLVELGAIGEDRLVTAAFAQALGVTERPDVELLQLVAERLAAASLLVADNCEQVLEGAAATIRVLLESCPRLRILATSREALQLPGEATWPLDPLGHEEAVELFSARARDADPGFQAGRDEIARLCSKLEGLPLAIELAAARVPALTVGQMLQRLEDRFRLLRSSARTAVTRQQTLEAAIDWSYQLLRPDEQVLFRRLAVFAGGFALEAAEAVCGFEPLAQAEVLDVLSGLVHRSLMVAFEVRGSKRYRLLDAIRAFAEARLAGAAETEALRERHAHHFATWAVTAREGVLGPDQEAWLDALGLELGNLRAASDRLLDRADKRRLWLCAALQSHAFYRCGAQEALQRVETALAGSTHSGPVVVTAMLGAAWLRWRLGQVEEAARLAEAGLEQSRNAQGEPSGWAVSTLSAMRQRQGRAAEARELSQQALEIGLRTGDLHAVRMAHIGLALAAFKQGDVEAARRHSEEDLAAARAIGNPTSIAAALLRLGLAEFKLGERTRCRDLLREAVVFGRGAVVGVSALFVQAWLAFNEGDHKGARAQLAEAAAALREYNMTELASEVLVGFAVLESGHNPARALQLAAAAGALPSEYERFEPGVYLGQVWQEQVLKVESKLGLQLARAAREAGARLSLEEALDLALATEPAQPILSRRELEVARFVAGGFGNKEIARRLFVSERTVEGHVEHALNKLRFRSRSKLAAWVVEQGLKPEKQAARRQNPVQ